MKELAKIAWRNIWRNKRRTLLTMASIFLAAFLSLFTRSMQLGSYANMIDNAVKLSTGYLQIHKAGYWENKSIDKTFTNSDKLISKIKTNKMVTAIIPRLESFALTSSGKHTKGSFIFAIIPELEDSVNHLSQKITSGEYLLNDDDQILVSSKLAEYLQVQVGDTLVLLGQGYHGITAAAQYRIKGIFYFPIPDLNNKLVYMSLKTGQDFYGAYGRITSYSLLINNPNNIEDMKTVLASKLGNNYEVMTWKELNRALVQAIESDNAGGIIMLGILYMVIGFGMFGTVMMMTMERRKEFAVMIAIGMQRIKLFFIIFIETLMIGTVAIFISIITALPFLTYLHNNPIPLSGDLAEAYLAFGVDPIVPFSIDPGIFINQTITIIIIALVVILYPLSKVLKLDILKSMRS